MADTVHKKKGKDNIIVNDIRIVAPDRTKKSVEKWRNAHKHAERVVNPNRTRLYDIYKDVLLDAHLTGLVRKRIDAVANKDIVCELKGKPVEGMELFVQSLAFRNVVTAIVETVLWGISGLEFMPGKEFRFEPIPRKHIKPETGIISYEQNGGDGYDYTTDQNIWIVGDVSDLGLLLQCAPYVIYKRDTMADWANYIEIFGQPVRVIKYDAHDEQTKIELKEVLDESGNGLALLIPEQAKFEMHDGKQSNGDGQLQERFKDALNQELSVLIVGNTETTTNGKTGSQAKSVIHLRQQEEITRSDMMLVEHYLNSEAFARIVRSYDLPLPEGARFNFTKEVDTEALKERIAIDKELKSIGVPIDDDYFYETYGVPKPDNYDEIVAERKQQAKAIKKRRPGKPADEEDEDDTDLYFEHANWWYKFRLSLADFFDLPRQ